jgi:hypothetical protein
MRICFDLDKTLCVGYPYEFAVPIEGRVELLDHLHQLGHTIIIYTARGMGRSHGNMALAIAAVAPLTCNQLQAWGFRYDELLFGKPAADIYIDDKALNVENIDKFVSSLGKVVGNEQQNTSVTDRA